MLYLLKIRYLNSLYSRVYKFQVVFREKFDNKKSSLTRTTSVYKFQEVFTERNVVKKKYGPQFSPRTSAIYTTGFFSFLKKASSVKKQKNKNG